MAFSLANVRTKVRERADMENSLFVKDVELNGYINASYAELYDLLTTRFEDYFSTTATFTLSGSNEYSLPTSFYKLRGLDVQNSTGKYTTVRPFNFAERNDLNSSERRYRLAGQKIYIMPEDSAPGTYRLWYVPRFTPLAADGDLLSDILDYEEFIVVDAAIKCRVKEETDITELLALKQGLKQRIIDASTARDSGEPQRIADVTSTGYEYDSLS